MLEEYEADEREKPNYTENGIYSRNKSQKRKTELY